MICDRIGDGLVMLAGVLLVLVLSPFMVASGIVAVDHPTRSSLIGLHRRRGR